MSFQWGNTEIYIIPDTYSPPWQEAPVNEIPLLPDPANPSAICTVLQQGGTKRPIVSFSTYVKEYSVYQGFLSDQVNGAVRTFIGPDGYSASMIIFSLTPAVRKNYPTRHEFSVTLMEAQ